MKRRRSFRFAGFLACGLLAVLIWWPGWHDNYHVVLPRELYRSAQMTTERLSHHIKEDGIHTVINLRSQDDHGRWLSEQQACVKIGVTFVHFPLSGDRAPSSSETAALVAAMRTAVRPILVHCEHGADRTSFVVALYLKEIARRPEQEARKAFSIRYGHMAFLWVGCFDDAFAQFCRDQHPALSQ